MVRTRPFDRIWSRQTSDDGDDDPTAITMTGQIVGNPAYMAETVMRGIQTRGQTLFPRRRCTSFSVTNDHSGFVPRTC